VTCGFLSFFSDSREHILLESQLAMASLLRLPAGSLTFSTRLTTTIPQPYTPISYQIRAFSQVPQRWAAFRSQNFNAPGLTQPSMKTRAKEAMRAQQMPNDIGLLPGTFIRPLWRDTPSIFQAPKDVWMVQWTWVKSLFQNWIGCVLLALSLKFSPGLHIFEARVSKTQLRQS